MIYIDDLYDLYIVYLYIVYMYIVYMYIVYMYIVYMYMETRIPYFPFFNLIFRWENCFCYKNLIQW